MKRSRLSRKEHEILGRYARVRLRPVKLSEMKGAPGIHIVNPSDDELMHAKDDAVAKGFSTVWVHTRKGKYL